MRHLLNGTTINMLVNVINNETVETNRVGEMVTRYSSVVDQLMINPETPTPRRISARLEVAAEGRILNIGPPKQADMAIIGYPIFATVTSATKSESELP